jgi:hypothetical protein
MDQLFDTVATISSIASFAITNRNHAVFLNPPLAEMELFKDIELTLYGETSFASWVSVHDLHIYLNGIDLTNFIIAQLKTRLNNSAGAAQAYARALDTWLELEEGLRAQFPAGCPVPFCPPPGSTSLVAQLKQQSPADTLVLLGNRRDPRFGTNGNLHIFNFIYRYIPLPPLSLEQLIEMYAEANNQTLELKDMLPAVVTFSYGPSYLFDPAWRNSLAGQPIPGGSVSYHFESKYNLSDHLMQIHESLMTTGAIYAGISKLSSDLVQIRSRVNTCEKDIGDHNNIAAVKQTLDEVKRMLAAVVDPTMIERIKADIAKIKQVLGITP